MALSDFPIEETQKELLSLPVLAVRGTVAFPLVPLQLDILRPISVKALAVAAKTGGKVLLLTQRDSSVDDPRTLQDFYRVGTVCTIKQASPGNDGVFRAVLEGVCRADVQTLQVEDGYLSSFAVGDTPTPFPAVDPKAHALMQEALYALEAVSAIHPSLPDGIKNTAHAIRDLSLLTDFLASGILLTEREKQIILEIRQPIQRMEKLLVLLAEELDILRCEYEIHQRVKEKIDQNQKDFFLREQIHAIQQELGEGEDECEEYYAKIAKAKLPKEITDKLNKEVGRMAKTPYGSAEGAVIRNYLDICLDIPFNKTTKDRTDIKAAEKILNDDHDGLEKVKERILEFLAVKAMTPNTPTQIICLVGPPGVGKTSVAASVARALKRKYVRVSLGGVKDESDIRGHRKTYVASMPGRIVDALIQAKTMNPLIVLDEIDKMASSLSGDPSAALLEVLDPEQNKYFRDHFVEMPIDLSRCIFIATANSYDGIPLPLLDRMDVIELPTYSKREKKNIAKNHLLPKQLKKHGLRKTQLQIDDTALDEMIDFYTREAGVRSLERRIADICRKVDRRIEEGNKAKVLVCKDNVKEYLGKRKVHPTLSDRKDGVGIVNGLAYTEAGGDLLQFEVTVMEGTGKLELTGSLGDVMKESAKIAYSYVRSNALSLGVDPTFYTKKDLHIHVPEGATPKDGPSAGVTLTTAIASALSLLPVRHDVAMTGEITLRGRVLPIGGLKEKTLAAYAAGVKTVLVPKENEPDLDEVDSEVKENLRFVFCDDVTDVFREALVGYPLSRPVSYPDAKIEEKECPSPLINPNAGLKINASV